MQTSKGFWVINVSLFVLGAVLGMFITRGESLNFRELQIFGSLAFLSAMVAIGGSFFYRYALSRSSSETAQYLFERTRLSIYFSFVLSGFIIGAVAGTQLPFLVDVISILTTYIS